MPMRAALGARLDVEPGTPALEVRRTYVTSDGEIAQVTINTHPGSRFRHSMTLRRVEDASRTTSATADACRRAVCASARRPLPCRARTPHRPLIDGDYPPHLRRLHDRRRRWPGRCCPACRSAASCPSCCRTGTRPPWSTSARRSPAWWSTRSCRRCGTAMLVHPRRRRQPDDLRARRVPRPRLRRNADRVTRRCANPPEVVVVRGDRAHTRYGRCSTPALRRVELPTLDADAVRMILYTSGTTGRRRALCTAITRCTR